MSPRSAQLGQAMVETAVLAVVFAALLAAVPYTLMLHEAQRTGLVAARDAVVLADWYRGRVDVAREQAPAYALVEALAWRHPRDAARLFDRNAVAVSGAEQAPPGRSPQVLAFIAAPLRAGGFLGPQFSLSGQGYREARIALRVPAVHGAPAPWSERGLTLGERWSTLTDAWNAGGSAMVEARVAGLVPTRQIVGATGALQAFTGPLRLIEPAFAQLCLGLIEAETIPARRLGGAVAGPSRVPSDRMACR